MGDSSPGRFEPAAPGLGRIASRVTILYVVCFLNVILDNFQPCQLPYDLRDWVTSMGEEHQGPLTSWITGWIVGAILDSDNAGWIADGV